MIPYSDNLKHSKGFYGVYSLILILALLNVPLFFEQDIHQWVLTHLGFIPILFSVQPWQNIYTLITSPLVHTDVYHLAGNCLFLWIFGRSLERLFGTWIFTAAFPTLGAAGLLLHWVLYPDSVAPVVGSSGAVALMMGSYLTLFPHARMRMIFTIGYMWKRFTLPAWAFLFYWIGLEMLSLITEGSSESESIAYAVHIGGFILGVLAAMIWKVSYPFAEERLIEFTDQAFQQTRSNN